MSSTSSKAYIIYSMKTQLIEKSIHIEFDEHNTLKKGRIANLEEE